MKYYKVNVKSKSFPMEVRFSEVKGEAMLFYSNDEQNKYPSMDQYSKLFIIEPSTDDLRLFPNIDEYAEWFFFSITT